jgi:hypothetical protein
MVEKHGNIMALVDIFAHLYILRRKRRGIQPRGIQKFRLWSFGITMSKLA